MDDDTTTTRRDFVIATLGGVAASMLAGACGGSAEGASGGNASGGSGGTSTGGSGGTGTGGSGGTAGASNFACTVYPAETEGPFYLDLDLVRTDITEGKPGAPMVVTITIVRAEDCAPMAGVAVDVWHADAGGLYSGYTGQLGGVDTTGQKFLRGTQLTNEKGQVTFHTIYPGWYPGRTTHIHFKIHPTNTSEATSQMYFDEAVNSAAYQVPPYLARGQKDTSNTGDGVVAGNLPPLATVMNSGGTYTAALTVAVA